MSSRALLAVFLLSSGSVAGAQLGPGTVKGIFKLSQTQGGRMPRLDDNDQIGRSLACLGDLDGNGTVDLATSGLGDDDGGIDQGAAYVLFLRGDGRVERTQKISELEGGFTGNLDPGDQMGRAMASIGDLDGDGIPDLALGANYDDDGGPNHGAVWLLMLRRDGTVRDTRKISSTQGGFTALIRNNDEFGRSIAGLGDLDGNGVPDLAVGAPTDSTGGTKRGAVYVLFMRADGTVLRHVKIASGSGGFTGRLRNLDWFGFSLANLGDFDHDGVTDLVVGAALDDDGATNAGAVWLLFLRADGTVKDQRKLSMLSGGFTGLLESPDQFGTSVAAIGDLNGDGITEIAVGTVKDGDGGRERGAVYVLFPSALGTVLFHQKISDLEGNFPSRQLNNIDWLGSSLAPLGDFDGDGVVDVAIGARNDDDGGPNHGAVYLTYLNGLALPDLTAAPLLDRGESSRLLDPDGDGETELAPRAATEIYGIGPEPEGSLELLSGDGRPGTELTFRLRVPDALRGRHAVARLFVARALAAQASPGGILLDTRTLLHGAEAVATPAHGCLEITLKVPATAALEGSTLCFQARWTAAGRRHLTDAVELRF